jgi:glycosyltransferase involved in cell wall biosynthesis
MKCKIQQFLFGANHSWAVVGKNTARALLKRGHQVDLVSTDGVKDEYVDDDLRPYIKQKPDNNYDMQFSYTALHNFPKYLAAGTKNKFGMWTYEFDKIPQGFAKYYKCANKFTVPSKFFYDICINNGISADALRILPHGVDYERFQNATPMKLSTSKKYKFLINIAQPHIRKNLPGTLEAFGKAFTNKDDVCLVIKVVDKKPDKLFEVSFRDEFNKFKKKYPNHAECIILDKYIPKIEELYKACDALFMLPNAEAFFFPAAEMLASGGLVITSNYGGQLDFLNNDNSILINGKMVRAPMNAQYWVPSRYASMFEPDTNEAAQKLIDCVNNFNNIKKEKLSNLSPQFREHFSWDNVAKMLEELCV